MNVNNTYTFSTLTGELFIDGVGQGVPTTNTILTGELFIDGVGQGVPTTNTIFRTIFDGTGNDTYDLSNYLTSLSLDLTPGTYSNLDTVGNFQRSDARGHIFTAATSVIENATGGRGNDLIRGNNSANILIGNRGNDTIYAGNGNDTIYGGDDNDVLYGEAGNDVIYGDAGNDTLVGGAGNDTLTGGIGNDTALYLGSRSQYLIGSTGSSGEVSITSLTSGDGVDKLISIEKLKFADATLSVSTKNDFDGDQKSDILFRHDNGDIVLWQQDGTSIAGGGYVFQGVTSDWKIAGTSDFNGDGKTDVLWRNDNGSVVVWQQDGKDISPIFRGIIGTRTNEWKIEGTGDFDGDGTSEILWRNSNDGTVDLWKVNGNTSAAGGVIWTGVGQDWKVSGTGDFNGDGKSDILWRNDSGAVVVWLMNGNSIINSGPSDLIGTRTNDWKIQGIDDFNGDGRSDILWRNDNGAVQTWQLNGKTISAVADIGTRTNDWKIQGTGDFNGDRKGDILWTKGNSQSIWFLNGSNIDSEGFTVNSAPGFRVVAPTV